MELNSIKIHYTTINRARFVIMVVLIGHQT